jgi:AcrR family transcriptional regulator
VKVTETGRAVRAGTGRGAPRLKPGVKKEQILDIATDYFGRHGYEATKWADVAAAVDIGSTALYHYFESKQHCLYEITARTVADRRERFERAVATHDDWTDALVELLLDGFELSEQDVLQMRVLVKEHGRVGIKRDLLREEAARANARTLKRDLEFAWGAFLARGMELGCIPENDPQMLARALLGLYNSVWEWYRPGGTLKLADVGRFFVERQLAILGCDPQLAAHRFPEAA